MSGYGNRYRWPELTSLRGLGEKLRDVTPLDWIDQAREIANADAIFPDEGGEFVAYFIGQEGGPLEAIPFEVTDAMHLEMMEAKRLAGWAYLVDYCLQLMPAIQAIETFCMTNKVLGRP